MSKNRKKEPLPVLIREHFNSYGLPKKRFKTRYRAEKAGWLYGLECYQCSFCGDWHLASREKGKGKI